MGDTVASLCQKNDPYGNRYHLIDEYKLPNPSLPRRGGGIQGGGIFM
jgi:hypothetical protein